jgi:hypothetical protein
MKVEATGTLFTEKKSVKESQAKEQFEGKRIDFEFFEKSSSGNNSEADGLFSPTMEDYLKPIFSPTERKVFLFLVLIWAISLVGKKLEIDS